MKAIKARPGRAILSLLPTLLLLTACLQLTPNVATDFSEVEARAVFEAKARDMCAHKKARIPAILAKVEAAEAMPTVDHWLFAIEEMDEEMEMQVFASGLVTGEYHRHIQESLCR